jgi:type I restriction enzyme R subunit
LDYYGILGELDRALTAYEELSGFDKEDLEGTLVNITEEIKTLPQKYADLGMFLKESKTGAMKKNTRSFCLMRKYVANFMRN